MYRISYYFLICILAPLTQKTTASPLAANAVESTVSYQNDALPDLYKPVGKARFRWIFLDLYDIKLSTPSGEYREGSPLLLEITYLRKISRERLVEATEKEWKRQSIAYQERWITRLLSIWPDVEPHDTLSLHMANDGISSFFYNNTPIGTINEKNFSSAFADIWLSSDTLKPKLRRKLIGRRKQ